MAIERGVSATTSLPYCGAEGSVPAGRSVGVCLLALTSLRSMRGPLLPRRNLNQLRQLFLGQRRRRVLERDRILHDGVETDHLVGIDRRLRKEIVARALGDRDRNADKIGVGLERDRI